MCFCASASFIPGIALLIVGCTSLAIVHRAHKKNWMLFAAIPTIFGLQQCAEGVIWLTASSQNMQGLTHATTYIFLICAFVIWPMWIPLAVLKIEQSESRKKIMRLLAAVGFTVSFFLLLQLALSNVRAITHYRHVLYDITPTHAISQFMAAATTGELISLACTLIYGLVVITPLMISSFGFLRIFGGLVAISGIATYLIVNKFFVSVWCFFAAVLSICIVYFIKRNQNTR